MEASIREPNLRNFIRLLQCAAKFGDDLNIHANKDLWELAVTNSTRSAFCLFKLRPSFFCRYKALGAPSEQRKGVTCQLLVKVSAEDGLCSTRAADRILQSVLAVLGKSGSMINVDRVDLKIVDPDQSLHVRKRQRSRSTASRENGTQTQDDADYEDEEEAEAGAIEAKLIMKLVCKHGVTKKHSLHLAATDFERAEVNPDTTPSFFVISAKSLRDMLDHFAIVAPTGMGSAGGLSVRSENQLGWMFTRNQVRIKSWDTGQQTLMTEIKIDPGEFEEGYYVEYDRVDLTIPMKEFRATLNLAEQLNISLNIAFSEASQPVTLNSAFSDDQGSQGDFSIFCAIATTTCEAFKDVATSGTDGDRKPSTTPSQPPARTSSSASGLEMGHSRGVNGTATDAPSRSNSVSQQKTKRSRLEMSSGQRAEDVSVVFNSMRDPMSFQRDGDRDQSGGSQLPGSQRVVMSQQELLEISGLGDMDTLAQELDQAEDEDFEEELTMSQQVRQNGPYAANEHQQDRRQGGSQAGAQEITAFEPAQGIFQEIMREEEQRQGTDEDDEALMSTQSQRKSGHGEFEAFFDD
ncbi:Rad9-domain-containing protein [Kockovaella imperatae]|uniref:Rad9-domain-containing protein n=1 Tax=Kockovaella imperatae TaxID=4999 RepID=A0A1Y1UKF0_9TREE|nr:Rad9-domain-containing protein [Kockovaella imperatae]ORX37984.1 Rad9-domain-containing protein [Kockovaella imperatae]